MNESLACFRELSARYYQNGKVEVTIKDKNGRRSTDKYIGNPLQHEKTLDDSGRVRTKRQPKKA